MWFVEWLISIITYPVHWFWKKASTYREEGKKGSIILLFALSLSGVLLFTFVLIWGSIWLWTNHIEIVIGLGLIIWLYSYIFSKIEKTKKEQEVERQIVNQEEDELRKQAVYDGEVIKKIVYSTLRDSAESIGGKTPFSSNEIVLSEKPYLIVDGVIFHYFQLVKKDMRMRYEKAELVHYADKLREDIAQTVRSSAFPEITQDEVQYIPDGKNYYTINVDGIEDIGSRFYIRVVRFSPRYAEYLREKEERQAKGMSEIGDIPVAKWEEQR